jgi:hypothetical protein
VNDKADGEAVAQAVPQGFQVAGMAGGGSSGQLDLEARDLAGAAVLDDQVDLGTVAVAVVGEVDRAPSTTARNERSRSSTRNVRFRWRISTLAV